MSIADVIAQREQSEKMKKRAALGFAEVAKNDAIARNMIDGLTERNKKIVPEAVDIIAKQAGERAEAETRARLEKMNGAYVESDLRKAYREQAKHIRIDDDPNNYRFTMTNDGLESDSKEG